MRSSIVESLEARRLLAVFTVTNVNDSGAGSLREAINQSNNTVGIDTIAFNISGANKVIRPGSELPGIWDAAIVDGTTQPGYTNKPLVQIDGSGAGSAVGLKLFGSDTVKGLSITNFSQTGIDMPVIRSGYGGNTIKGNWIGLDLSGNAAGNFAHGIGAYTPGHVIGGPNAADRNVISASKNSQGILVQNGGGTIIQGNYIGTDPTGMQARGNKFNGVGIQNAPNCKILNNVISGNEQNGIILIGAAAGNTTVQGNIVGLDASGNAALPNKLYGIEIQSPNNTIGGTTAAQRNIFSAAFEAGIVLHLGDCYGNQVIGNYIGTDITGTLDRGNRFQGIAVATASNNTIKGNLISGNDAEGVGVFPGNNTMITENIIGWGANGQPLKNNTWGVTLINGSTGNTVTGNWIANNPSGAVFNGGGNTVANNPTTSPGGGPVTTPGAFAFSAGNYNANETAGTVTITVTRTSNNTAASVSYATSNGTASSGSDYNSASGTLNFASSETSKTFTITLINDTQIENGETVNLSLSAPTGGATLANPSSAVLTIVSEDQPDTTGPTLVSARYDYSTANHKLIYQFSEDVSASLDRYDVAVVDEALASYWPTVSYDRSNNTATFSFNEVLPSHRYTAYLFSGGISDQSGNALAGGNHTLEFYYQWGDLNHDGAVAFVDLLRVAANFGKAGTFADGDANYDGAIGFTDLLMVSSRYGEALSLPQGAPAAPLAAASSVKRDPIAMLTSKKSHVPNKRVTKVTKYLRPFSVSAIKGA